MHRTSCPTPVPKWISSPVTPSTRTTTPASPVPSPCFSSQTTREIQRLSRYRLRMRNPSHTRFSQCLLQNTCRLHRRSSLRSCVVSLQAQSQVMEAYGGAIEQWYPSQARILSRIQKWKRQCGAEGAFLPPSLPLSPPPSLLHYRYHPFRMRGTDIRTLPLVSRPLHPLQRVSNRKTRLHIFK